jgi:hypothetical protein
MDASFHLVKRSRYPRLFLLLAIAANAVLFFGLQSPKAFELSIPATGVIAGFVYFLYSQHLQETRLFADLFREFNKRYDELNDNLNEIVTRPPQPLLSNKDKQLLYDYFNLCAEEYLYYNAGSIVSDRFNGCRLER